MDLKHRSPRLARFSGNDIGMEPIVFESCHSTWLFDTEQMRFRRVLKGLEPSAHHVSTEWRPYFGLELDADGEYFSVMLNAEGSRLLRSWRHTSDCVQCGGHVTSELSLEDLRFELEDRRGRHSAKASA